MRKVLIFALIILLVLIWAYIIMHFVPKRTPVHTEELAPSHEATRESILNTLTATASPSLSKEEEAGVLTTLSATATQSENAQKDDPLNSLEAR